MSFERILKNPQDTEILANELVHKFKGKTIFLNGPLGAGKTTFVKYFAKSMGFPDDISSPTFSIVNNYFSQNGRIIHFDLYRIESEEELEMTGFYELIGEKNTTVLIECAEKFDLSLYIKNAVTVIISVLPDGSRKFEME